MRRLFKAQTDDIVRRRQQRWRARANFDRKCLGPVFIFWWLRL